MRISPNATVWLVPSLIWAIPTDTLLPMTPRRRLLAQPRELGPPALMAPMDASYGNPRLALAA